MINYAEQFVLRTLHTNVLAQSQGLFLEFLKDRCGIELRDGVFVDTLDELTEKAIAEVRAQYADMDRRDKTIGDMALDAILKDMKAAEKPGPSSDDEVDDWPEDDQPATPKTLRIPGTKPGSGYFAWLAVFDNNAYMAALMALVNNPNAHYVSVATAMRDANRRPLPKDTTLERPARDLMKQLRPIAVEIRDWSESDRNEWLAKCALVQQSRYRAYEERVEA